MCVSSIRASTTWDINKSSYKTLFYNELKNYFQNYVCCHDCNGWPVSSVDTRINRNMNIELLKQRIYLFDSFVSDALGVAS
jgi:hypothetical protein